MFGAIKKPTTGGGGGGGTDIHNDLQQIQGGITDERYHLDAAMHQTIYDYFYQPPTLNLSPNNLGTFEVGRQFEYNENISVGITNIVNVKDNEIEVDGTTHPLPFTSYNIQGNEDLNNGWNNLSQALIRDQKDDSVISQVVRVRGRYRVFWVLTETDLFALSDGDLTSFLQNLPGSQNQLNANKNIGNQTLVNNDPGMGNIYVAVPKSYGVPQIANQAFPTNPVNTDQKEFDYTFEAATTDYYLVKMTAGIGGGGSYDAVIN